MPIDLVIFDMAGTTVYDGDAVHAALANALVEAGVRVTRDQVNAVMGMPKPVAIRSLLSTHEGKPPLEPRVAAIYASFERLMLTHYRTDASVRAVDNAEAVFRTLHARFIKVALDTGFTRRITDVILQRLGWNAAVIDASVTSDEVARGRPYADMVHRAMKLTGVRDSARVAKVGDTPADLLEGDAANCALVVGVTNGSHTREQLQVYPHTHLIASLTELPAIVERAGAAFERAPGDLSAPLLFTPGPLTTSRSVKAAMTRDVGSRDAEFIEIVADIRARLLAIAGTSRQRGYAAVPVQGSGTFAVESMLGTFVPAEARLLVLENGAYGRRMLDIARVLGIQAVALSSSPTEPVRVPEVRRALGRGDSITHAAVVHCETTSGVLNPLTDIAKAVHDAGCTLLVDAMSSFGAVPIDAVNDHIDALAASSNKCLEGAPGLAFVIARTALLESAPAARSVSLDLAAQWRGLESDGQFRFTPPTHVVLALHEALVEHEREGGVGGRAARYRTNHERLVDGMRRLGFREVVAAAHQSDVITSFYYPDDPSFVFDEFYARLRERNVVIYPGKLLDANCFRIGTIGRIYPEDIDAMLAVVRSVLSQPSARGVESVAAG